jgi:CrcB protein
MFIQILFVGLGGFIGAVARFCVYELVHKIGCTLPLATLLVNITGSVILGFVLYSFAPGKVIPVEYRLFVNAGIIGAFTTMGTFAHETIALLESGAYVVALVNILLNIFLSLCAVLAGKSIALYFYAK